MEKIFLMTDQFPSPDINNFGECSAVPFMPFMDESNLEMTISAPDEDTAEPER